MSDPLRTDGARALDGAPDADRDAKIEQLLLSGLDHYFAGHYDQAINVWTRALFLDRSHQRARAYIERARSALAERQRQSEELLQTGIAAFHRGDADEARRLLQAAIDAGAPPEDALAFLERLNRLDSVRSRPSRSLRRAAALSVHPEHVRRSRRLPWIAGAVGLAGLAAAAVAALIDRNAIDWRAFTAWPQQTASPAPPTVREMPPLPRRGETIIARASVLAAGGHLRDALALLDAVRPTDPQKATADRLRAQIQRQLIAVATGTPPSPADRENGQLP
jgi:tetratricopeptide (TPR) repeat protein